MKFFFPLLLIVILSACLDAPDCLRVASSYVNVSFKTLKPNSIKYNDTTIYIDSIIVRGSIAEKKFKFYEGVKVAKVSVPVNSQKNTSTFLFYRGKDKNKITIIDSLEVSYNIQKIIINPKCPSFAFYSNLAITLSTFPNNVLINSTLGTNSPTNIEIRF